MKSKFKRAIATLLALMLTTVAFSSVAYADNWNCSDAYIEIPVLSSDEEYEAYMAQLDQPLDAQDARRRSIDTSVSMYISRDGNTDDCELYYHWVGTDVHAAFRYKTITVTSSSVILDPITYKTFGNGIDYTYVYFTAAAIGMAKIGDLSIPASVEKVRVKTSGGQGYDTNKSSWMSLVETSHVVTIN